MTYTEQRLMIARLHTDLRLRLDAVVHDERHPNPHKSSPGRTANEDGLRNHRMN